MSPFTWGSGGAAWIAGDAYPLAPSPVPDVIRVFAADVEHELRSYSLLPPWERDHWTARVDGLLDLLSVLKNSLTS